MYGPDHAALVCAGLRGHSMTSLIVGHLLVGRRGVRGRSGEHYPVRDPFRRAVFRRHLPSFEPAKTQGLLRFVSQDFLPPEESTLTDFTAADFGALQVLHSSLTFWAGVILNKPVGLLERNLGHPTVFRKHVKNLLFRNPVARKVTWCGVRILLPKIDKPPGVLTDEQS